MPRLADASPNQQNRSMSQLSDVGGRQTPGLRERKKAKTKAAIQREAVRLFLDQGYAATTVEQIAAAAEVAPSTVFRYFPAKQDLVISDDYDQSFFTLFQGQSPELTTIQAERKAIMDVLGKMSEAELNAQRERWLLLLSVPELWGAGLDNVGRTMQILCEQVAKRAGRDPAEPAVRAYVGAVFGVMFTVSLDWARDPDLDFPAALNEALAYLEEGGLTL
jgi:AcrR family transcriptional regulator